MVRHVSDEDTEQLVRAIDLSEADGRIGALNRIQRASSKMTRCNCYQTVESSVIMHDDFLADADLQVTFKLAQ